MSEDSIVWVPIDLREWPDPTQGTWSRTDAGFEQQYGEQRIVHAQEAEDEASSSYWEGGAA